MFKFQSKNQKWRILFGVTSCISMIFLDITVLPVALPTIHRSLNLSNLGIQWMINGYLLALTLFVVAGGRLGDRIGHKKTFLYGLLLFTLSSASCGLASNQLFLIAFRIGQGCGAALMIPSAVSIIFQSFPKHQRGKAMGLYVGVGSIFLALGPFLGGLFSEFFHWRLIFWINIPIALVGFLLTIFHIPKEEVEKGSFDLLGFLLSTLGISCLVIPLMMVKNWGWASFPTLGIISLGILFLALLVMIERKVKEPFLNFSFFKNPRFNGVVIAIFITQFLVMVTVFWALYFQNIFHYTPTQAGLITMLAYLPIMFMAPLAGHLLDRLGPFLPITLGYILITSSLFWFILHIDNPNIWILMGTIVPFGCGIPLIFTPSLTYALNSAKEKKWGLASGTLIMLRQLGGTLGLAIIGSLFFHVQGTHFASDLKMHKETISLHPTQFTGLLASAPDSVNSLNTLHPSTQTFVKKAYTNAYIDAFWTINLFAIFIAIFGLFLVCLFFKKRKKT